MSQNEHQTPDDAMEPNAADQGPEVNTSGPESQAPEEELTVADILGAAGEAGVESQAQDEIDNPYIEDLRRLNAEYANYRKRTEASREEEAHRAKAKVVEAFLGVLDDFDRVEKHGDLEEGSAMQLIVQKVRNIFDRLGLEGYGEAGEIFDPQRHEAIAQVAVPGTEVETVLDVVERGYRIGTVELRPAKVAVAVSPGG